MNLKKYILLAGVSVAASNILLADNPNINDQKKSKDKKEVKKEIEPDTLLVPIPKNREMWTDKVFKAINGIDAKDGTKDGKVFNPDEIKSKMLTQIFITDANKLLIKIENANTTNSKKIGYERALSEVLNQFKQVTRDDVDVVYYRQLMKNFEGIIMADIKGNVVEFVKNNADVYSLENIDLLGDNEEAKGIVYKAVGLSNPEKIFPHLNKIAKAPYTDEVIASAAQKAPRTLMSYAAPNSKFGYIIRRNQDPTVKTIVKIVDNSPKHSFKVLQFLNQIKDGEMTIAEADKMVQDNDNYFRKLIALKISGKAISDREIEQEISDRSLIYVRKVNELHENTDAVRFRSIEGFEPEEYYFMLLGGQTNEIYTSSYLGIFKRMIAKMGKRSGYELMEKVRMSNFRTFIRMAAGYNTASTFLGTMSEQEKTTLLTNFVSGLEKGSRNDLTDAVDVADAFGSLTNETLLTFLKNEVEKNYERVYKDKKLQESEQEKGIIVYGLLASIFNSSTNPELLQNAVKEIPPINFVDINSLQSSKGEVIAQIFFYGDEDGKISYANFLGNFRGNKNWKIDDSNPNWVKISSVEGKLITYYGNKPLTEPKDEEAQNKLYEYLDANEIKPTVVIHRGHSYHLEGSLKNITPEVKIVVLGSCGGFHNLANVLDKSPDAHIISTKQVGSYLVNDPIIRNMNEYFLAGKNVDWLTMWQSLNKTFSSRSAKEKELFSDYIPPNKNLGAIFIKAYRKLELAASS